MSTIFTGLSTSIETSRISNLSVVDTKVTGIIHRAVDQSRITTEPQEQI